MACECAKPMVRGESTVCQRCGSDCGYRADTSTPNRKPPQGGSGTAPASKTVYLDRQTLESKGHDIAAEIASRVAEGVLAAQASHDVGSSSEFCFCDYCDGVIEPYKTHVCAIGGKRVRVHLECRTAYREANGIPAEKGPPEEIKTGTGHPGCECGFLAKGRPGERCQTCMRTVPVFETNWRLKNAGRAIDEQIGTCLGYVVRDGFWMGTMGAYASVGLSADAVHGDYLPKFSTHIEAAWRLPNAAFDWPFSKRIRFIEHLEAIANEDVSGKVSGLHMLVALRHRFQEAVCAAFVQSIQDASSSNRSNHHA